MTVDTSPSSAWEVFQQVITVYESDPNDFAAIQQLVKVAFSITFVRGMTSEQVEAAIAELARLAGAHPGRSDIALAYAKGLVNRMSRAPESDQPTLMAGLIDLADDYPDNPDITMQRAAGLLLAVGRFPGSSATPERIRLLLDLPLAEEPLACQFRSFLIDFFDDEPEDVSVLSNVIAAVGHLGPEHWLARTLRAVLDGLRAPGGIAAQ
jgi:hypothetical protein